MSLCKRSSCLQVSKLLGQRLIVLTDKLGLRDKELKVKQDADFIYVPLARLPISSELEAFKAKGIAFSNCFTDFQERTKPVTNLRKILKDRLPSNMLAHLPRALDIVGDIAIVEISSDIKPYADIIGKTLLQIHRNVKTVLAKAGPIGGLYRLREFTVIAGEQRTWTVHREFGCQFYVDLAKAYFSPRLSYEHMRVASQVQKGEAVVDLFSGVGPFAVIIAKNTEAKVFAIDINPEAFEFLQKNIYLNRVQHRVFPFLGDARHIVHQSISRTANRVIMNMPERATEYVDVACEALNQKGGVIHFYAFQSGVNSLQYLERLFRVAAENAGKTVDSFFVKTVRETAPHEHQVVFDVEIS